MALVPCPECGKEISDFATACPMCGVPLKPSAVTPPPLPTRFVGPPVNCSQCGGQLKKEAKANQEAGGCALAILGLLLTPLLVGIPILLYGIHLGTKREGLWRCTRCQATFPRVIRWNEYG